jgi:trehalose-phosphatase
LKVTEGKLVRELMPDLRWNKGHAVAWLLERARLGPDEACPLCLGDDLTDEDMFDVVRDHGITVLVGDPDRPTGASYALHDCEEVLRFLRTFATRRPETLAAGVD